MTRYRLSQDEMDCLLHGLAADAHRSDTEPALESASDSGGSDEEASAVLPSEDRSDGADQRVDIFRDHRDSPPAITLDAERMRGLQSIHEVFAGLLSKSLSEKLRTRVGVRVTDVQQPSFGQFVFGLNNPTCFLILDLPPLPGKHFLEIHPTILFPMIDRLLGGGKHAGPIVRRPLTDIEQRLVRRLAAVMLDELRNAWRKTAILQANIEHIESNPKLARCAPPAELMHVFELEVELPVGRGPVRLALPDAALAAVHDQLAGKSVQPLRAESDSVSLVGTDGDDAEVRVIIAEWPTTSTEIDKLAVGDILDLGIDASSLAEVRINNQTVHQGRIGNHQGRKAVRLAGAVETTAMDHTAGVRRAS